MATKAKKVKPISKLRLDLLQDLADYLNKLDNQFDLTGWVKDKTTGSPYMPVMEERNRKLKSNPSHKEFVKCGMVACAMGHAPSVPSIAAAGLKLTRYVDEDKEVSYAPTYKRYTRFEAAQELFGISAETATHFFDPDYYEHSEFRKPKAVAKRIAAFVKDPFGYMSEHSISV